MGVTTRARSRSKEPSPGPKTNKAKTAGAKSRRSGRGKQDKGDGLDTIREEPSSSIETSDQDQHELREKTPRLSEGPEFTEPTAPPTEAIEASRQEEYPGKPPGFSNNPSYLCYRNALVAVLLSSNRIMSWIQHRYIAGLENAGVQVQTYVEQSQSNGKSQMSNTHHTDIWCELYELHKLSRDGKTTPSALNKAMTGFWKFMRKESDREVGNKGFSIWQNRFKGHQDSHELLAWWLQLSGEQTRAMADAAMTNALLEVEDSEDQVSKLFDLATYDIKEITRVSQTHRHGCVDCNRDVRFRGNLVEGTCWEVPLTQDPESPMPKGQKVKVKSLEDLLSKCVKSKMKGVRCEQCYDKFDKWKEQLNADAEKDGTEEAKTAAKAEIAQSVKEMENRTTFEWQRLCSLPEVLILHLGRFKSVKNAKGTDCETTKDETRVTFEETLDVAPFLEPGMSFGSSTTYRLVAVLSHIGELNHGHYVSDVYSGGCWYTVNDQKVSQTTFDDIKKETEFTPYILLYEKVVEDGTSDDDNKDDNGGPKIVGEDGSDDNHADKNGSKTGSDGNDEGERTDVEGPKTAIDQDNTIDEQEEDSSAPWNPCLPTYSPHDGGAPLQMQLAGDRTPEAGQYLVQWWATINGCNFELPKFLLEAASIPPEQFSKDGQGGWFEVNHHTLQVNLKVEDSQHRLTQVSGAGMIQMPLPGQRTPPPGTPGSKAGDKRKRGNDEPVASPGNNKKPRSSGADKADKGDNGGSPRSGKGRSPSAKSPKTKPSPPGGDGAKGGTPRSAKGRSPSSKSPKIKPATPGSSESWKEKNYDRTGLNFDDTVVEEPGNHKEVSPANSLSSLF
ncbi:hypothetical protein LTR92_006909 [Exophiala xenobiotica]|nr:hypothetical protein LTR92_006909 [Exophiala xenobiotica]